MLQGLQPIRRAQPEHVDLAMVTPASDNGAALSECRLFDILLCMRGGKSPKR